jgi:hypothetical protein
MDGLPGKPKGAPDPEFPPGSRVVVMLDERNRTAHRGVVRTCIWHFKLGCWTYWLEANGKKIHKRYLAEDLRADLGEG